VEAIMATENFLLASLIACGTFAMYPVLGTDPLPDAAQDDHPGDFAHADADVDEAVRRAILLSVAI
jgi:hypothetical protein